MAPAAFVFRHRLATRLWHWINAVALIVLVGSGLGISNAHPRLYWGQFGANWDAAWWDLPRFPAWLTIPASYNLAISRRWHLFFALVLSFGLLAFMIVSLVNRHFRQDLGVRRGELSAAHLGVEVRDHWNFRFHDPDHPRRYNSLQKLSYIVVLFLLLPLVIATGLALSPGMNAAWPWLLDILGGRQSARSIHFLCMIGLVAFTVVHLVLVILAGAWNEVRSMLTGRWRVPEEPAA